MTSVSYLGGKADSYTLNFSRPASGIYVQYYKFLRYGLAGYQQVCDNMMGNAKYIRDGLRAMTWKGRPRFVFSLCRDENPGRTMFRIVVKNNLTRRMADHLLSSLAETFEFLDAVDFSGLHAFDSRRLRHRDQRRLTQHC